jgi:hypothetical protein
MIRVLHNIGKKINGNYTPREIVEVCKDQLTFDGVYKNVWENRDILKGKDITLFIMGNYIGGDNSFDISMPLENYCDWNEIRDLVKDGAKIGWHTWNHIDLRTLSEEEIRNECTPPFPMDSIAYPYGEFDERVIRICKEIGFKRGYSVNQGDNSEFQINREYL